MHSTKRDKKIGGTSQSDFQSFYFVVVVVVLTFLLVEFMILVNLHNCYNFIYVYYFIKKSRRSLIQDAIFTEGNHVSMQFL